MEPAAKKLEREALFFRMIWMAVYGLLWQVITPLLLLVVILQLLYRLFSGKPHDGLMRLGDGLGGFLAQIARFCCFRTDDKPWPVADWPARQDDEPATGEQSQ